MNKASMQRRVWEYLSQLKVTYRDGPLGHTARKWFSSQGPLLGDRWALVVPARTESEEYAAVVAERLGDDRMTTLVADHDANSAIMLVRPDAHLGWRGRADPDALDRWLTAVARQGRAG